MMALSCPPSASLSLYTSIQKGGGLARRTPERAEAPPPVLPPGPATPWGI